MAIATHHPHSCLRTFALAIPSAWGALFPDVPLAHSLTSFQSSCYILSKDFWQTPPLAHPALFFSTPPYHQLTHKTRYLLLIMLLVSLLQLH